MVVVLKSDMAGEDEAYVIGAVELPNDANLAAFQEEAIGIMDEIRKNPEYEDEDLLNELTARGYKVVPCTEITVRY